MKKLIAFLLLIIITESKSQNEFQQFINYVNSIQNQALKTAAVDSFIVYARTRGIPFITGDSANFIYRGNVNSISVAGDFNGWNSSWNMINLPQTNFWFYSKIFESDARLDYKFVTNGSNWILDPENPKQVMGGFGPNSELAMPDYIQPWEINYRANIPHGTIINKTIFSVNVNTTYQLRIYLPPDYDSSSAKRYPTVYFQDGFEYITLGYAANVIGNLLDSNKIEPVIAVFVRPNNRNDEYAGNKRNQYRLFFVDELVPYIDSTFKTIKQANKRLVLGDSFGGNISAIISYNHPEVFGLCGLHSGAFWPYNYEIYNQIINGPIKNIKWCSIWGSYEGSLVTNMRNFRNFLQNNNNQLYWKERPEGHSWGLWRETIDDMLMFFFPYETSSIKDQSNILEGYQLFQNYPNPFSAKGGSASGGNPNTTISFSVPKQSKVNLKIFDILGNEVAILFDGIVDAGYHQTSFNADKLASGIYFYRLDSGEFVDIKKMILIR